MSRRRQRHSPSLSDDSDEADANDGYVSSDESDVDSCFDIKDEPESDNDTDPTDDASDADGIKDDDDADLSWITGEDNVHPPEYYVDLENDYDECESEEQDYSDKSILLLDFIETRFTRFCQYTGKDADKTMQTVSCRTLKAFFEWMINQRRGKGGKRITGIKSANTLGTYWKVFRLVYERATGEKFEAKANRNMHLVLRQLAKKHHLITEKREKAVMYVEDLATVLQTNLTTTKKRFTHGRHRMQVALFLVMAAFSGNRPSAILNLCYGHIRVSLLRDPSGGPHRIVIELTYEFTKQYLGVKDANTFVLPEIIFDPSLVLSPHVYLLGILLADKAFSAPNLTSAEKLSMLDIRPGCEQLPLDLRPELANVPVFRASVKTVYGYEISPHLPLTYATLKKWLETLGVLAGFLQILRPYCLRYGAGNAFNQSGDVSDALQNLIMQHASMDTFIKHYQSRRITADTRAIVSGYDPQYDLMRAACRMTRWIDPERPQELTAEQSKSVDDDPHMQRLLGLRARWKRRFHGTATEKPGYRILGREIVNARKRLRAAKLKQVKQNWELEQPLKEIELQLSGLKFNQDVKANLDLADDMPSIQKRLVETVMTLPGTTLVEEVRRRNAAINAVAAYCHCQEGGAANQSRRARGTRKVCSLPVPEPCPQQVAAEAERLAIREAMMSLFKPPDQPRHVLHRPRICFLCLGEESLLFDKRVKSFKEPGDLTKHFKRSHLQNYHGGPIECKICLLSLKDKDSLRNHAERIHGTVSRSPAALS